MIHFARGYADDGFDELDDLDEFNDNVEGGYA
jgi:hypothetical protein